MSTNLYWRPVPKDPPPKAILPYALKKAIAERFWGHDGSLFAGEVEIDVSYVPYLEGLCDGRVEGAAELLAAVRAHGAVELWIEE